MPLQSLLDLSTAHLRSKDNELLERYANGRPSDGTLIAYGYDEYGYTVSTSPVSTAKTDDEVPEVIQAMREEGFSEEFVNLLLAAEEMGAVMVRFDRDADLEPGFPAFDWANDDERIDEEEAFPGL